MRIVEKDRAQGRTSRCGLPAVTLGACSAAGWFVLHARPLKEKGKSPSKASSAKQSSGQSESTPGGLTNFLLCGIDETESLTDVIMVVSCDSSEKTIGILQIPRDTYAGEEIPSHKYNAVYGTHKTDEAGMEVLRTRVERDFGIAIDHYAAVTLKGFRNLVDAVGGVDLTVPIDMNYDDSEQNLHIHLKKGYRHLTGAQAEQYVRYRKGWTNGDLGRLQAQKSFLAAFAQKFGGLRAVTLGAQVLSAVHQPDFLTDLSAVEMLRYAAGAKDVASSRITVYTVPGQAVMKDGLSVYVANKPALAAILNSGFAARGVTLSAGDLALAQLPVSDSAEETASSGGENFDTLLTSSP